MESNNDEEDIQLPKYTISDAFRMFCIRTNGHGWFRIVRARSFCGMIIWFLLTFICFGLGIGLTIHRWTKFTKYDTDAPVAVRIGGLKYPSITVCSSNPIKNSMMAPDDNEALNRYRNLIKEAQKNVNKTFNDPVFYDDKLKGEYLDVHVEALKYFIVAREQSDTTVTDWAQMGYSLSELVLYCKMGSTDCITNFAKIYDPVYGNCYTLKPSTDDAMSGTENGIHLIFNTSTADFLPWYTETDGTKLIVHQVDTMPLSDDAYTVISNKHNEFAIEQSESKRLEAPYNDPPCEKDFEDFERLFGYTYSFRGCQKTCLQRQVIHNCSCSDRREPTSSITHCTYETKDRECLHNAEIRTKLNPELCMCPLPCEEIKYHVTSSFTQWPAPKFSPSKFRSKYGFQHSDTTSVLLYFKSIAIRTYEEIPRENTWQFLGWMGGQLYAWCGASVVTALEFILFLLTSGLILFTENVDWALEGCNNYK